MKDFKKIVGLVLVSLLVYIVIVGGSVYFTLTYLSEILSERSINRLRGGGVSGASIVFFVQLYRRVKAELIDEDKLKKIKKINEGNNLYHRIVNLKEELKTIKRKKDIAIKYDNIDGASDLRIEEKRIENEIALCETELHKNLKK